MAFLPSSLPIMPSVAILVAGPVSNRTKAAPGDTPAIISPAAMGVEAVAQIYIGMPASTIINIAGRPCPHCARKSGGKKVRTAAAKNKPISSQSTMPSNKSVKAYLMPSMALVMKLCWFDGFSVPQQEPFVAGFVGVDEQQDVSASTGLLLEQHELVACVFVEQQADVCLSFLSKILTSKPDVIADVIATIGRAIAINGPISA